jgi:hypothetical protein
VYSKIKCTPSTTSDPAALNERLKIVLISGSVFADASGVLSTEDFGSSGFLKPLLGWPGLLPFLKE